jgi:hypothetical protein
VEYEIHHVAYSYREQQVIGEECFGDRIDSKRLGFIQQRYSCREKAYDEKREEVIAYQQKQKRMTFRIIHANDLIRLSKPVKPNTTGWLRSCARSRAGVLQFW